MGREGKGRGGRDLAPQKKIYSAATCFGGQSQKLSKFSNLEIFNLGTPCIENLRVNDLKSQSKWHHKSCVMNRQIRVEKIIATVKCVATCGTIEIQPIEM